MNFDNISETAAFASLLLSVTRRGDVDALESYLSTINNPDLYLNQVYDDEYMQKCTLLAITCLNGYEQMIDMLLCRFQPDLEVLNNVNIQDENINRQLFLNVSVLWIAASINNFKIVKLLVNHGADVNHTTKTNSTPLRAACYNGNVDVARYLVDNGANIHIAKENNDTNLMVSTCYKHINMVRYLVDELACDVNVCDNRGRSPLYDAVRSGSRELVEFLIKHDARNFRATVDQMSPLMWAAERRYPDLMKVISSQCTLLEQIEAEELLGSAFVCGTSNNRNLHQAFEHFHRALELRSVHHLPKPLRQTTNEIFGDQQECQTIDDLKNTLLNLDSMYVEALLIRERLLGVTNEEYRYSLCYRGAILADHEQYHEAVSYWIYELRICQQYSISLNPKHLRHLTSLLSMMLYKIKSIPIEPLLTLLIATSKQLEHDKENFDYNLYTLLFLITITSQVLIHKD